MLKRRVKLSFHRAGHEVLVMQRSHSLVSSVIFSLPLLFSTVLCATALPAQEVRITPPTVELRTPESFQQLLVTIERDDGLRVDATRAARYTVEGDVARVSTHGVVTPVREGTGEIVIEVDAAAAAFLEELEENVPAAPDIRTIRVRLDVTGLVNPTPVSFRHDVIPSLTKARCNSGGCHGKSEGKGGFKLSVFGFDPKGDHEALVQESRGRRVFTSSPENSLFLLKGTAAIPHGGGLRVEKDSLRYRRIERWVREGASFSTPTEGPVKSIEIEPKEQILYAGDSQQIRVTAIDQKGKRRCVTAEAEYESNETLVAAVEEEGLVRAGDVPGEAAVLVRYMGHVAVCRITHPRPGVTFERPPEVNFVDGLVWNKLERLGIAPSELADDATFLRRVYLDTIGTLPTAPEARDFLNDTDPAKRSKLVDTLLERPEYADYWAMKWANLLRLQRNMASPAGALAATRWLRRQFAENRPYDEFVNDILTVKGNLAAEGPAALYRVVKSAEGLSRSVSQLFLGVRIECAQCHHHPSERWGQEDYYALAGFFTGLDRKGLPRGGESLVAVPGKDLIHPRTREAVPTRPLGGEPSDFSDTNDRREKLAEWMIAPDNPYFATVIANRLWAHYFGRGLVEPVDDLRATNPATNEPLMDSLSQHLRDVDYDLRSFTRTLLSSRAYQLSTATNESNATDRQNFSHAYEKAVPAEVLLDAICQVSGVGEKFGGWPAGYRATQVWDSRMHSYFFKIFGRPQRLTVCECERSNEPSIAQALHLMNSKEIADKLAARDGRAFALAAAAISVDKIIDEVYLSALARYPRPKERAAMRSAFGDDRDRRLAVEDVLWAVMNSKAFIYNH